MFEEGLIEEVRNLYDKDNRFFEYKSINSIGYQEFKEYFLGNNSLLETKELIKRNTRRLAKRQITWFKHQTRSKRIDIFDKLDLETTQVEIESFLKEQ